MPDGSGDPSDPRIGSRLGRYAIARRLGAGGMGVVYEASDGDRRVALKLIARELASRPEVRARFMREARIAGALDHPNIGVIHGVEQVGDELVIVMALYDGETLAQRIARGPLAVPAVVEIVDAIASGLAAAHRAGVVHRDVKPANVLLTDDGGGVLLDFGLAKPIDDTRSLTADGAIVGTVAYMAPEQIAGADTDVRTDLWALGALIYEAIAGFPPFGARAGTTYGARPRPLRQLAPHTPAYLGQLVAWLLERDPLDRPRSAEDVLAVLRGQRGVPRWRPRLRRHRRPLVAVVVPLVIAGSIAVVSWRHRGADLHLRIDASSVRRVTQNSQCDEYPSFLPDGNALVYDSNAGRPYYGLSMVELRTRASHALLHDSWDYAPAVSPDGASIAFLRSVGTGATVYLMPTAVPNAARRLAPGAPTIDKLDVLPPAWSPDGSSVWTGRAGEPTLYEVVTGKPLRTLAAPAGTMLMSLVDFGDGKVAAVAWKLDGATGVGVVAYDAAGAVRWLFHDTMAESLVALDRDSVLASRFTASGLDLWQLSLSGAAPEPVVANGVAPHTGLALSRDHDRLAWSTCDNANEMIAIEGSDAATRIGSLWNAPWESISPAAVFGTDQLVFVSTRGGAPALWLADRDGHNARELSTPGLTPEQPSVSLDGRWVAFGVAGKGIFQVALDGGVPRRLTADPSDLRPVFSRDGRTVYFLRLVGTTPFVMTASVAGGEARSMFPAAPEVARAALATSPTEDLIAYIAPDHASPVLYQVATGRTRVATTEFIPGLHSSLAFSPDGKRLAVQGGNDIVEIDLATGKLSHHVVTGGRMSGLTYLGETILAWRARSAGNLWTAEVALQR